MPRLHTEAGGNFERSKLFTNFILCRVSLQTPSLRNYLSVVGWQLSRTPAGHYLGRFNFCRLC